MKVLIELKMKILMI